MIFPKVVLDLLLKYANFAWNHLYVVNQDTAVVLFKTQDIITIRILSDINKTYKWPNGG